MRRGCEMIELIVSVCMIDDPSKCKDVRLNFMAEAVSVHECMLYGQVEIAKWTEGHPNWAIKGWKCGVAGQVAKI